MSASIHSDTQGASFTLGHCVGGPYSAGMEGQEFRVDCCLAEGDYTLECINFTSSSIVLVDGSPYCADDSSLQTEIVVIEEEDTSNALGKKLIINPHMQTVCQLPWCTSTVTY